MKTLFFILTLAIIMYFIFYYFRETNLKEKRYNADKNWKNKESIAYKVSSSGVGFFFKYFIISILLAFSLAITLFLENTNFLLVVLSIAVVVLVYRSKIFNIEDDAYEEVKDAKKTKKTFWVSVLLLSFIFGIKDIFSLNLSDYKISNDDYEDILDEYNEKREESGLFEKILYPIHLIDFTILKIISFLNSISPILGKLVLIYFIIKKSFFFIPLVIFVLGFIKAMDKKSIMLKNPNKVIWR